MALKQIKSLVQFSRGTSIVLNELTTPIPDGVVIFSIDDGAFKIGDGSTSYTELETLFNYTDLVSAQGGISGKFEEPVIEQNGKIVIVTYDQLTSTIKYGVSDTSLQSLLDSISAIETVESDQTDAIALVLAKALSIDTNLNTANDNNVVVINSRRYMSSGQTLTTIQSQIASQVTYVPGSHLEEVNIYHSSAKVTLADQLNLADGSTYYVDIVGFNNNEDTLVYGLTAANSNVVINQIEGSLFSIQLNNVTAGVKDNTPFVLIASIDNQLGTAKIEKAISCLAIRQRIIAAVYGGTSIEYFEGIDIDSNGNVYAVGRTSSEGAGATTYASALIVKFDSSLNKLAGKSYSGTGNDYFLNIAIDSNDNLYVVGTTNSEGSGSNDALIIKFDSSLNKLAGKRYGASSADMFLGITVDSDDNIYAVGNIGTSATIVKFDSLLNILIGKSYSGASADYLQAITTDSNGNVYAVGRTNSEGVGATAYSSALIVKFDSSLNKLAGKIYSGVTSDYFNGVVVDSSNNIYVSGYTGSEGPSSTTYSSALIVKFDSSLNKLAGKVYGGTGNDYFWNIVIDSSDNIHVIGYTESEGLGLDEALIIKFDSSLNKLAGKLYGGTSTDRFCNIIINSSNNVYAVGYTKSEGTGNADALITRFPNNIPSGSFTGTILTGLTLADSALTLSDSALTLADSALTLADSTSTLADSALTLADSALTLESDYLN